MINFNTFKKPPPDFKEVSRLTVSEGEMQKKTVMKSKFSQINDKRFYFTDGITSLPLSHPHLQGLIDFKTKKGQSIERYFLEEKETLLGTENSAQESNKRLFLYHQILMSEPKIFCLDQKDKFTCESNKMVPKNIKEIVLEGKWIT